MKTRGSIRDPVHGQIDIYPEELEVIESSWFQRLRHIRQLGLVNHVYPGAEHTRFSHCLGVMHLAGKAVGAICGDIGIGHEETEHYVRLARLAGLLHDIGHAPFSHVGEADLFPKGIGHEDVGARIILEELADTIDSCFKPFGISADEVRRALRGLAPDFHFVTEVLTGATDVDKMDYLLRDAYFCGSRSGEFDLTRLLTKVTAAWTEPENRGLRTVVYRYGALHALEEFLLARYWMFNSVYYHSVVRQLEILLARALKEVLQPLGGHYPEELAEYLDWTDEKAWTLIAESKGRWSEHLRKRRPFFQRIYSVAPSSDKSAAVRFASLRMALETKFGDRIVADEPRVSVKFYSDDEEGSRAPVRVETHTGDFVAIRDESAVLKTIPDAAIPYRIFAEPEIGDEAAALAEEHLKGLSR
jgi:uncharacterized protein